MTTPSRVVGIFLGWRLVSYHYWDVAGGDNVTVVLRSGNAFEQHLVAQDRTDGTYLARFIRPNAAYDLDLVINGQTHDKVCAHGSATASAP
jgi:hypothetical protein